MFPWMDAALAGFKGLIQPILDKAFPDANEKLQAETQATQAFTQIVLTQIAVNLKEAESPKLFIAGWRPAVGWICMISLGYSVIGVSILNWILAMVSAHTGVHTEPLPIPDTTIMLELLLALLGVGTLRTYEKIQGVTK